MANKITLSIAGFNLIVNTTEDEDHVRKLNATLNEDLSQILQSNPSASVTNAALLCSLDYLDRYDKATHSANNLRTQIKDYLSEASNAKLMYDDEVKKNAELVKEVQTLRAHVTKLAADGANGSANEEALRKELDSAKGDAEIVRRQLKEQLDQNRSLLDRSAAQSERLSKMEAENQRLASLLQTASTKL
ncbi:MAG: cell division protein ZapA, partial [Oscillospiraceae bacterium]|nr:cell division protein ZapA [Oscillospiraceae bacterium]